MPDFTAWALVDALTVNQAACLWVGAEPTESDTERKYRGKTAELDQVAAVKQMLSAAIRAGELSADPSANPMAMIGDDSETLVSRETLREFAETKNQRPAFLFDTLLPQEVKHGDDVSDDGIAPSRIVRSRGGRPAEYDWDAFVIEIIRIANTPDGLPEKQSELLGTMLYWCEETWGKQPAQSTAKYKISKIYNGLGLGRKS